MEEDGGDSEEFFSESEAPSTLEAKLFHACAEGDIEEVMHYLDLGANINMICTRGRTPFGAAAVLGNVHVLKTLLGFTRDAHTQTLPISLSELLCLAELSRTYMRRLQMRNNETSEVHNDEKSEVCDDEEKAKVCIDEEKAKVCIDEEKAKVCKDEKAKVYDDEEKAKVCNDEEKAKVYDDEEKAKVYDDEEKAKVCNDEEKAKVCNDEEKAKVTDLDDKYPVGSDVGPSEEGALGSSSRKDDPKTHETEKPQSEELFSREDTEVLCSGKPCESCRAVVLKMGKINYDLACYNDNFAGEDLTLPPEFDALVGAWDWNQIVAEEAQNMTEQMTQLENVMNDPAIEEVTNELGLGELNEKDYLYNWYTGVLTQVRLILERKPHPKDMNLEDQFGCTPLHYAAAEGHRQAVRLLIKAGCRATATDLGDVTPLHLAAAKEDPELVQLLIDAGADVNKKSRDRISPLHVAASRGHLQNVKTLVEAGCNVDSLDLSDRSPLFLAVCRNHGDVVSYLVDKGARVNVEEVHGYTPLFEAVSQKNPRIVRLLLHAGARLTPHYDLLHYAIINNQEDMVRLLMAADPRVNIRDENGDTPLILAARTRQPQIVRLLLQKGAFVNHKNRVGNTALHEAIFNTVGKPKMFEKILEVLEEFDVDFEAECELRWPALYLSLLVNREAAAILIRHGAKFDPICKWRGGNFREWCFYLTWAVTEGWCVIVELLVYAGYNVGREDIRLPTNSPMTDLLTYYMRNPMKLTELCRIKLRNMFGNKVYKIVNALNLPQTLKTFLKLEDVD